jgi:uncharacterized membrane protein YeaQ/YmgE (transglycosylase-associated protein family)
VPRWCTAWFAAQFLLSDAFESTLPIPLAAQVERTPQIKIEIHCLRLFLSRQGMPPASHVIGGTMTVTGIISAILIGIVIGALGRLVVPGKQHIPIWLTILVGIGAAFLGTGLARAMGIPTATEGIDWLELLVQVIVAAVGVAIVAAVFGRRRTGIMRR